LHVQQGTEEEYLMTPTLLRAYGVAAALGLTMAAFAQTPEQQPVQPQPRTRTSTPASPQAGSAGQTVRVVGCIQSEADFRKARNLGRGGTAGTGVGVGNEFVLIDAKMASAGAPPAARAATGTVGAAAQPYKLTGANEGKVSQFVGRRVEITGTVKPAETPGAAPTRRPTAGGPPAQIDVFAGEDLKLRELDVTSVRETPGTCPAK
jgi:hypothetical protein